MPKTVDDFNKSRLRSSNITVVISISLVLFLVGLFGLILINAQKYSDYIKEQLVVEAYFDEYLDPRDSAKTLKFQEETFAKIKQQNYVKQAEYISKEKASVLAKKQLGIDSDALFEEDIFPASVEVTLKPEFVDPQKIDGVVNQLKAIDGVKDVVNDNKLTIDVYNNLNRILTWIFAFSVLFLVVAIVLINNSIRLKIFSKRFIIKTMQLVGAKRRFILMPFIKEALVLGLIGALIALLALGGTWYYFTSQIGTPFVQDTNQYVLLVIIILFVGIFITIASTIFATWRFLRSNVDDLYYS
ncbi:MULTISPECIES: cell division protein FtsX [Epilithonimonas]|jgi:cell division transport system permease protein|uniref:Cell division protein FtsX n=2 Tax=Epilithonimonas TaxID=2782229 RepID=A0A3G8Y4K6_9FLAO|nr:MULTISPECIES: ABC transporter permease [Epilithonimonas]AZI39833.1 FtsX-like permease family protein [Epilithonimonas vandammei]AZI55660.1 FtsX-like permease family protein [Epilithonimonas vandammei]ROI14452.1 ABC transporter permease [Epilithonimonas hominis]HAP95453.1 cell division protein FtsX [Chryseobacterium sp.]